LLIFGGRAFVIIHTVTHTHTHTCKKSPETNAHQRGSPEVEGFGMEKEERWMLATARCRE